MTTEQKSLKPPTPQVQYLPAILRRVQDGELRVPAFQRGYVWTDKQVRELLQSVYKGYPIGSLLFWSTTKVKLSVEGSERFPFPKAPVEAPVAFVLDGMQRLATLYNCFFPVDSKKFPVFNVAFDLRTQEFAQFGKEEFAPWRIRLSSLFSPKEFLDAQRRLTEQEDGDKLIDQAIALHSRFQEYMIPTVTIEGREITEVVEIFERINNTGTKLSSVDFMRAVTWSEGFDLTVEIGQLARRLEKDGFKIPQQTLVKVVAVALKRDPTLDAMLKLRGTPTPELKGAVAAAEKALRGVVEFLRSSFRVLSYDYIPYEAQLLVLCRLFLAQSDPSPAARKTAQRWFWSTSFNESLQGKAESVVAGLLRSVDQLVGGDPKAFEARIDVEPQDLVRRRFIAKSSAISCALGALFASRAARSVVTGKEIPTEYFMSKFSSDDYFPVFSSDDLGDVFDEEVGTAKLIPNVVVVSPEDRVVLRKMGEGAVAKALAALSKEERRATLASQAISAESYKRLAALDRLEFLAGRANDIVLAARESIQ
jgi:hypothetical protein